MSGANAPLEILRRQASRVARKNLDLSAAISAFNGEGRAESDFERAMRLYPPGPVAHDLRGKHAEDLQRADLSSLRPGDTVLTDSATIQIDPHGAPVATLRPGYGDGRSAARVGPIITPPAPTGVSVDENIALAHDKSPFWFRDQVRNKQPWDYKQQGPQFQAFGNYNYGATGRALPLPAGILEREAGRAQIAAGTSSAGWGKPGLRFPPIFGGGSFGDDPVDQYWIGEGVRYHDAW